MNYRYGSTDQKSIYTVLRRAPSVHKDLHGQIYQVNTLGEASLGISTEVYRHLNKSKALSNKEYIDSITMDPYPFIHFDLPNPYQLGLDRVLNCNNLLPENVQRPLPCLTPYNYIEA